MSTAYQKIKTLCINLRNEIYSDIQIHNQNILPRYLSFLKHIWTAYVFIIKNSDRLITYMGCFVNSDEI
jgi:hypothetical protein